MDAEFACELRDRFPPENRYLAGISGGRDSMALWHLLREAGYENLVACHLNHQLRGADSDGDAALVAEQAARWNTVFEGRNTDTADLARKRRKSIETAAREARHEFFAAVAEKHKCPDLFLAHHADDQVETSLINLCRGSGLRGIAGMAPENRIAVGRIPLHFIRPLLGTWRREIDDYVETHGIRFREDASNAESDITRNRIRHELIPLMGDIFDRDVRQAIHRLTLVAAGEDEAVESILDETWPRLTAKGEGELEAAVLLALNVGLQRKAISRWLRNETSLPACGFREVETIRGILSPREKIAKVNLPGGWHARRNSGRIFLQPPRRKS